MARVEDLRKSEFIMKWNLKHFSFFCMKENQSESLLSKTIVVPSLENSGWYLKLESKGLPEKSVLCFLCRTDDGPDNINVSYSISVGSYYAMEFQAFGRGATSLMPGVTNQEKFINDVSNGLCKDVLHIECHLWLYAENAPDSQTRPALVSPYPVSVSMSTSFAFENRSFFHEVENFSGHQESEMARIVLASAIHGGLKLAFRLWADGQTLRVILREHDDLTQGMLLVLKCKIYFLDVFKKRHLLYSGRGVLNSKPDRSDRTWNFKLSMSKKDLIEKKDSYLPKDALLLHCEIAFFDGLCENLLERTIYNTSDLEPTDHKFQWGMHLDHMYNEHRVLFRLLAILVVVLSFLPHLFSDSTV